MVSFEEQTRKKTKSFNEISFEIYNEIERETKVTNENLEAAHNQKRLLHFKDALVLARHLDNIKKLLEKRPKIRQKYDPALSESVQEWYETLAVTEFFEALERELK